MSILNILSPIESIIETIFGDKAESDKAKALLREKAQAGELAIALKQIEVNLSESKGNWLQRSWRPIIGHTCAAAFAWSFVIQPILANVLAAFGNPADLPTLDTGPLMAVMLGMLGLGGARTIEKFGGKAG